MQQRNRKNYPMYIRRFCVFKHNELKHGVKEYMSLYDAMGFSEARTNAMQHNVFESSIKYITADGADGAYIRVVITPDIVEAKRTEKAVVTVYDKAGKAIRKCLLKIYL